MIRITYPENYEQTTIICSTETNPNLMSVLYAKGLCANENYMTLAEAKACTNADVDRLLYQNETVVSFDEFQYFTGVTEVGDYFASDCTTLKNITLPNTITSIGLFGFGIGQSEYEQGCRSNLEVVNGVENVEIVGPGAFHYAEKLLKLNFTQKLKQIWHHAFYSCTVLESIGDVSNVESTLDQMEFYYCQKLQRLNFTNKVSGTLNKTFSNCNNLKTVGDMSNIDTVGVSAFDKCYVLERLNLSNKITSLGNYAFYYCMCLIEIGDLTNVTSIGKQVFACNYNLQTDLILTNVTSLAAKAFIFKNNNYPYLRTTYYKQPFKIYFGKEYSQITKATQSVNIVSNYTPVQIYFNGTEATQEQYNGLTS